MKVAAAPFTAWIGLGANLGDARAALAEAVRAMAQLPGTRVMQVSSLYRTAAVDATVDDCPDYLNAVARLETTLDPLALLHALQGIEQAAGRERPFRNAPRTLDLDVLWIDGVQLDTPELTVPHPRWAERAFVLQPWADLAPERVTALQLQAVAEQRVERLMVSSSWWGADITA
jgi:2-amino-4-hydroxy-6-hydroxymethyldihydropteridine diphosphokinase